MRSVLLAAAGALFLAFGAHGAEAPDTAQAPNLPPVTDTSNACIDGGASISHVAYSTDDDAECCASSSYCPQYLSTQTLVTPPATGHT